MPRPEFCGDFTLPTRLFPWNKVVVDQIVANPTFVQSHSTEQTFQPMAKQKEGKPLGTVHLLPAITNPHYRPGQVSCRVQHKNLGI